LNREFCVRPFLSLFAFLALAAPALSAGPSAVGLWLRENGASQVRIAPCGAFLCGYVAWVQEPEHAGDIGLKVFYDMKPAGSGKWEGSAFNPEDGKTYSGKMLLEGAELKTSGCVFGGLICKSVNWTRLK
jgi:uncharacterized protein (DUF2147 family)